MFLGKIATYDNKRSEIAMNICGNIARYRGFHTCSALMRETPNNIKGKKPSSQHWLIRQLRDPYVEKAKQENYRCRSAFKLIEMNDKYDLLKPGITIVDCGAAPGSWSQVAVKMTNSNGKNMNETRRGKVIAIDRLPIHPIEGAIVLGNLDLTTSKAQDKLLDVLNGESVDLVMSDMAPNATGIREMDHDNIIQLAYSAMKFALTITRINGNFVTKVWDGGESHHLEADLARFFKTVKIVRPGATRDESAEKFILARGFKGLKSR